jgi:hypothetical protein
MLLIILLFIILISFFVYKCFYCKNNNYNINNNDDFLSAKNKILEKENTDIIISYGETIETNLQNINLHDINTIEQNNEKQYNKNLTEDDNIKKTNKDNVPKTIANKSNISTNDIKFLDKFKKYIIGKYALVEKSDIMFINDSLINNFNKLFKNNIDRKQLWNNIISETTKQLFYNIKDPSKKLLLGQTIIKNSNSNEEIIFIYSKIVEIASDQRIPTVIRMNAVDILNMSNNSRFTTIAKKLIRELGIDRNERKTNFERRLENVYNRASKISLNNSNQTINNINITPVNTTPVNNNTNNNLNNNTDYLDQRIIDQIPFLPVAKKPERTIYQDGQNVHATKVNETALETSKEIVDKFKPQHTVNFDYIRISKFTHEQKEKMEGVIHRLTTDPSEFRGNTLYTIYQSVLNLINNHKQKDELYNRLIEEMLDMHKMCATGHLTRLINVIQGYDTNINNNIKVSIDDELYAKIKHIIEKELQEDPKSDELLDDILTPEKNLYIKFINEKMSIHAPKIYEEYKNISTRDEIKTIMLNSLNKYTQTNGKISFN